MRFGQHSSKVRTARDLIRNERVPFDYVVKQTKFAGPTCFQRGDNNYYNQRGELLAKQRSTSIRYRADLARKMSSLTATEDPEWSDERLRKLEIEKFAWIKMLHDLGHGKRYWEDVKVGDALPTRIFGPHSIVMLDHRVACLSVYDLVRCHPPYRPRHGSNRLHRRHGR